MDTAVQVVELLPSCAAAVAAIASCVVAILAHGHSKDSTKSRAITEVRR
jgi:hypothetical protein